jgi:nitroimidazol reductase NimA-like FMN-containing flavoprotein (pyridoxamine 5'-phosphate oxidase superfamily)
MADHGVPPETEALLEEGEGDLMANVATSRNGRPHVAPVWYHYEDGVVEFVTGGRKLANLRENHRTAISVEKSTDGAGEWHVVLFGTAEIVTEEEALWAGRTRLFRSYRGREPTLEEDGEPPEALVRVHVASTA